MKLENIKNPPCPECKFWNPTIKLKELETEYIYDGTKLCWNKQMYCDFSCYIERNDL